MNTTKLLSSGPLPRIPHGIAHYGKMKSKLSNDQYDLDYEDDDQHGGESVYLDDTFQCSGRLLILLQEFLTVQKPGGDEQDHLGLGALQDLPLHKSLCKRDCALPCQHLHHHLILAVEVGRAGGLMVSSRTILHSE